MQVCVYRTELAGIQYPNWKLLTLACKDQFHLQSAAVLVRHTEREMERAFHAD